jgi:hypothetical protein
MFYIQSLYLQLMYGSIELVIIIIKSKQDHCNFTVWILPDSRIVKSGFDCHDNDLTVIFSTEYIKTVLLHTRTQI